MFAGSHFGLVDVSDSDLQKALRIAHKGEFRYPLDAPELARVGLQHCSAPLLAHLRGLDQAGVRAVLVAVLAERKQSK